METYQDREAYLAACREQALLPAGFRAATTSLTFYPLELGQTKAYPMNLSLILLDEPTPAFHAMFTKNLFCGAPIILGRERLREKFCRGILANNKISNVATPTGLDDAEMVLKVLAKLLACKAKQFFPASTGIIGWRLPAKEMCTSLPVLVNNLQAQTLLPVAEAIMTTDSYPKVRRRVLGEGSIVACAKGAGMIEPALGTMLLFVLTDLCVPRALLAQALKEAIADTINCISIDGDQSTSDLAIILSSCKKRLPSYEAFKQALKEILAELSDDIVRNGEGAGHVIRVSVTEAPNLKIARLASKAIVNSPLVKTAIYGNDPNVGRIVAALGDYLGLSGIKVDRKGIRVRMGGITIFEHNSFLLDENKEQKLSQYLRDTAYSLEQKFPPHKKQVEIEITLGAGRGQAWALGSDLGEGYVKENSAYRS